MIEENTMKIKFKDGIHKITWNGITVENVDLEKAMEEIYKKMGNK